MGLYAARRILERRGFDDRTFEYTQNPFGYVPERADTEAGFIAYALGPLAVVAYPEVNGGHRDMFLIGFPQEPGHFGLFAWEHNDPRKGELDWFMASWRRAEDAGIAPEFGRWMLSVGLEGYEDSGCWPLGIVGCLDFVLDGFFCHPSMDNITT